MSQLRMDALPLRLLIPYTFLIWILLGLSVTASIVPQTALPYLNPDLILPLCLPSMF